MEKIENKKIVRQYADEIENSGDVSNIQELISEDYVEIYEGERYEIGIKGAIDHVLGVSKRQIFCKLKNCYYCISWKV